MIALLQRVSEASVKVEGEIQGRIAGGILALIGVEKGDTRIQAARLLQRLVSYRIFPDEEGKMNRDLRQARGKLLLVPQFTLAANTNSGNRPSFTPAAPPSEGERLFNLLVSLAEEELGSVQTGVFGANMSVGLVNEGPVTFWLQVPPTA